MKILFYRYGSICEPDVIETFAGLGHEVVEIQNEIYQKNMPPSETARLVSRLLDEQNFQMVFTINFFPVISDICSIYRIRYVCWSVDSPVMELFSCSIKNQWNRVFLFDLEQYNDISPYNPSCVFHLPLATNPLRVQKLLRCASREELCSFRSDVSFVGSLYTEKNPYDRLSGASDYLSGYLNAIMEAQLKVYGYYFIDKVLPDNIIAEFKEHLPGFYAPLCKTFLDDRTIMAQLYLGNKISSMERLQSMKLLSSHFQVDIYTGSDTSGIPKLNNRGFAKSLTEMPLIFHESKINLNITARNIRAGIPLRIWDILGCGGFCLTNYQPELTQYFTPGEHLDYYGSLDELYEKTEYYLSHDKERREIAQNGAELIRTTHNYENRISRMLEIAFSS